MRIVLSILMLLYFAPSYGQDIKQQINTIKKSQAYINAEATESSREEAFSLALEEMTSEVNSFFASNLSSQELREIASKPFSAGKDTQNNSQQVLSSASTSQVGNVTSVFSRMNTFTEIKSLLRQYKGEGKISEFNWVSTKDVSPEVKVIIFKEEKIVSILLQERNGKRINYLTNKEDDISNYSGCRAIWYKE